jgi:hypothetical protein
VASELGAEVVILHGEAANVFLVEELTILSAISQLDLRVLLSVQRINRHRGLLIGGGDRWVGSRE